MQAVVQEQMTALDNKSDALAAAEVRTHTCMHADCAAPSRSRYQAVCGVRATPRDVFVAWRLAVAVHQHAGLSEGR